MAMGGSCFVVSGVIYWLFPRGLPRLSEGQQVSTWSLSETLMTKTRCSCCEGALSQGIPPGNTVSSAPSGNSIFKPCCNSLPNYKHKFFITGRKDSLTARQGEHSDDIVSPLRRLAPPQSLLRAGCALQQPYFQRSPQEQPGSWLKLPMAALSLRYCHCRTGGDTATAQCGSRTSPQLLSGQGLSLAVGCTRSKVKSNLCLALEQLRELE